MMTGHLGVSSLGTELLDDPAADPAAVTRSLRNVARANRWFGGAAAVRYGLGLLLRDLPRGQPITLLDLGTGGGVPGVDSGVSGGQLCGRRRRWLRAPACRAPSPVPARPHSSSDRWTLCW